MKLIVGKNSIPYMQDMSFFDGIPKGKYNIEKNNESLRLIAPGYGERPDNYGNGAIYVRIQNLPLKIQKKLEGVKS